MEPMDKFVEKYVTFFINGNGEYDFFANTTPPLNGGTQDVYRLVVKVPRELWDKPQVQGDLTPVQRKG